MIILRNIMKDYRVGNHKIRALNQVDLQFSDSEFICVHGPSGCGKTTLLNIIGGLDRYTAGELIINGVNTAKFTSEDWDAYRNQNIGFVFQSYYLLPQLTVLENVEMPLNLAGISRSDRNRKALQALEAVGLKDEAGKYPNQLSGGQMQRVAIARAIVNDPEIILADEPTGALDSKNAEVIMNILKSISRDRLVILVSHNEELSRKYADRTIELFDGKVIADIRKGNPASSQNRYRKKKVHLPFSNAFLLSLKNLLRTKLRTPLTVFAGCIGMIGIGLVLSVSEGVTSYIEEAQKSALANYPIYISSVVKTPDKEQVVPKPFPETRDVKIKFDPYEEFHLNTIDEAFLTHIKALDPSLYTAVYYNRTVPLFLVSDTVNGYKKVSPQYFYELPENEQFVRDQYDVLAGTYPKETGDAVLLIDRYNNIDATFLANLKIDFSGRESFSFDELLNREFRLVENDSLYENMGSYYIEKKTSDYGELYNSAKLSIKIVGIMRVRKDARAEIWRKGLLYTSKLTDYMMASARESEIVKEQIATGLAKDVYTGMPFEDYETLTYKMTAQYQYEERLFDLGAIAKTSGISIYTSSYEKRDEIENYINTFDSDESYVDLTYTDRMKNIIEDFVKLARIFSSVLIIFSSVSLIVSSILIGILTYVSVNERTHEIGLLRSIGARKKDISLLFNFETLIIGFFSGVLGNIGVLLLLNPVNAFVQTMIEDYTYSFAGVSQVITAKFEIKYALILIFGSMILTLIAGFIPSKIAAGRAPINAIKSER